MKASPDDLVSNYLAWLKEYSTGRDVGAGWSELTIPYVDRHNDFLQVYVREDLDGLTITDEGQTIRDLRQVGCDVTGKTKRRILAESILKSKGLDPSLLDDGQIRTKASDYEFAIKLHATLMSMLAIGGLASTSPSNVATIFKEDVSEWLVGTGLPFDEGITLKGKSLNEHEFDFWIPENETRPARIIQTFHRPETVHIESYAYRVIDSRDAIPDAKPEFLALFSDSARLSRKSERALLSRKIRTFNWSDRDELARRLEAA